MLNVNFPSVPVMGSVADRPSGTPTMYVCYGSTGRVPLRRSATEPINGSLGNLTLSVESAGTVTSRRQHHPVRREVRPEEVRSLGPPPAVHFRPLPTAVRVVCPLSDLRLSDACHNPERRAESPLRNPSVCSV